MTTVALVTVAVLGGLAIGALWARRSTVMALERLVTRLGLAPGDGHEEADEGEGPARSRFRFLVAALERGAAVNGERTEAAQAERRRLAGAIESIPQGVVICDETGREVFRNRAAVAYVRGRHGEAVVEQAIQERVGSVGTAGAYRRTLEIYGPPRRVLVVSAFPLGHEKDRRGTAVIVDDVSERARLEAVRRDFVANLSHELKTPVGALGLLADTIAAEDDVEVVSRLAERMTTEAFRVGRIIDDLLDLSRIEAEESQVSEPVAVVDVVNEAAERVRSLADARGICLDPRDLPGGHTVTGDRRQLVAALANLLDNACKYSDEGSRVEVRSWDDAGFVEVEVRDHGIGIPSRDLERVFERFYRVDRARSRETGGTGLGLAIVRHVASNHGGEVRVASREGEGSVFTLRLPGGHRPASLPSSVETRIAAPPEVEDVVGTTPVPAP